MKADRSQAKPRSWLALTGWAVVLFAAAGYVLTYHTPAGPWVARKLAAVAPSSPASATSGGSASAASSPDGASANTPPAASTPAPPATRIVRVSPADVRVIDHVRLTTEELLDPNFALFDTQALTLSPPRRLLDEIERPLLVAEVVNTSPDTIALSPQAKITVFDGSKPLNLRQEWALPTHLYPGERVPVALVGGSYERYTEVKTDWMPAKRAALPGPRPKLAVTVENTEAGVGTGTLNFSYRYRYKYVTVHGRVRNDDQADVEKVRVWVSLYDAQDKLSGALFKELSLPKLAPGDSAPFEVTVKQHGGNFARVGVVYDAAAR